MLVVVSVVMRCCAVTRTRRCVQFGHIAAFIAIFHKKNIDFLDCKIFFICYIITSKGHTMNKQQVEDWLRYHFAEFIVHWRLFGELLGILAKSGVEKVFFKQLFKNLSILRDKGILATKCKDFEPIEHGLYSMHFDYRDFNIRILYAFRDDEEPVLLLAFYERGGKRRTDYSGYIKPACDRLAEMKGMN